MGTHPRIRSHICRSNMRVMIALGFLAVALIVTPSLAASSDDSITWGPIQNVTHSTKSFDPVTVVDSNNKTHIVYAAETSDGSSDNLMYTNNVNGSFSSPQTIQRNIGSDRFPFFSLALGPNNTLHLVYSLLTGDKQLYYRQGTLNGANVSWSSPQLVSDSGTKSIQPTIIVDSAGNVHLAWNDHRCSDQNIYNVFYRVRHPDGSLTNSIPIIGGCNDMQRATQLTVTSDGKVHAVLQNGDEIYYARLEGNTWTKYNLSQTPGVNSYVPTITTDGTALYVAWDEGTNGHDIHFRRSMDGGQNWSNTISFSDSPAYASYPSAAYSASSKLVYVVWVDATNNSSGNPEMWYRIFNPSTAQTSSAKRIGSLPGPASLPVISVGPRLASVVWQDKSRGVWDILTTSGSVCTNGVTAQQLSDAPAQTSPGARAIPASERLSMFLPLVSNNLTGC